MTVVARPSQGYRCFQTMAQSPVTVGAAQDRGELAVTVFDQLVDLALLRSSGTLGMVTTQDHGTRRAWSPAR
jgi:hypothetical protein